MDDLYLLHIDASRFYAAVILNQYGRVIRTAPIVGYMRGWTEKRVRDYCTPKGWKVMGHPIGHKEQS
jgi:hypothetical protein